MSEHKINYKNIGMILLLGIMAINIGMSQYRPVNIDIKVPDFLSSQIMASSITVNQTMIQNSMSLSSVYDFGILILIGIIGVCVMFFIYAFAGLGGMGGRR